MKNQNKLEKIFLYSKDKVKYYQSYESFSDLPILKKEQVQANYQNMISSTYNDFESTDKLSFYFTSGSTGKCLKVFWNKDQYNKSLFYLWYYRKKYYSISPNDKLVTFFSTQYYNSNLYNTSKDFIEFENAISFSKNNLNGSKIINIYNKMIEFSPKWIIIQPSILELMIYYIKNFSLPVINSIEYIECTGEYLSVELKKTAEQFFSCIVANQYGCVEMNSIAYMCPNGHLHIMEDNVFIEEINNRFIISTLNNYAMPLLRYDIGDTGSIFFDKCPFNSSPIIVLNKCRKNEYIKTEDGKRLNPYILSNIIESITDEIGYIILQYQFIQTSYYEFIVKFNLDKRYSKWENTVKELFYKYIKDDFLKKCTFNFQFCNDELLDKKSGKMHFFVNQIM